MTMTRARWWVAAMLLLVTLPLLPHRVAPLNDLPDHIGRYHIAANLARSADLQRHWIYAWRWIGNLGVDLLAIPLARWIGVEAAARIVVTLLPAAFVLGLAMLARVRGRRLPPLAGFAAALAYNHAFQLGFVNFALATALAFVALAGWIAWARRPTLRGIVFAFVALLLWTVHSSGWGMFGLMAWASDVALRRERGAGWLPALFGAALACLPLALPAIVMVAGEGAGPGEVDWNLTAKAAWIASLLRDRWRWIDVPSAVVIVALLWTALRRSDWRFDRVLAAAGAALLMAFVALPRIAMNGAYIDMRLLAPAAAILLIAVRIDRPVVARRLFGCGIAFLTLRMIATTASFAQMVETRDETMAAVGAMPHGASVLILVAEPCSSQWASDRLGHIGGLAIVRRDGFNNSQWAFAGQQLVRPRYPASLAFRTDPSQLVYPASCDYRTTDTPHALRTFDRQVFSYVWLIGFGPMAVPLDLTPRFRNRRSTLYAVVPPPHQQRLSEPAPTL